jgi:NAD(P)H-flavin reductase
MTTPVAPQAYTAKLSDKQVLNDKFTVFHFELVEPNKMEFLSGQYVSFAVSDSGERRSYSISSTPDIQHGFEVTIDVTPNGIGVQFFNDLEFGSEVKFLGPMGQFILQEEPKEEALVFVATGSGVAPMRSMIVDLLRNKNDQRDITLYWGLRYEEQMIWQDEMQDYAQMFKNFHFHPVLSKAKQEWPLCRGRVTDCLDIHDLPENAGYYLCGNTAMIEDVKKILTKRGVVEGSIHHEKFY